MGCGSEKKPDCALIPGGKGCQKIHRRDRCASKKALEDHPTLALRKPPDSQVTRETMDMIHGMAKKSGRTVGQMIALINTSFDQGAGIKKKNK